MRKPVQICVIMAGFLLTACTGDEPRRNTPAPPEVPAASTSDEHVQASKTGPVIIVLGDSLSAGFGLSLEQALPAQLQTLLQPRYPEIRVINAGVSGDTTGNGLARYEWSVTDANPDLVIVALGANDYLLNIPPETARENLRAILQKAKSAGHKVVLAGLESRGGLEPGAIDMAYVNIYPELAQEFNVPLHPGLLRSVRSNRELLQPDGLHPTAEGVKIMAAGLAVFLEPHIPEGKE